MCREGIESAWRVDVEGGWGEVDVYRTSHPLSRQYSRGSEQGCHFRTEINRRRGMKIIAIHTIHMIKRLTRRP